MSLAKVIKLFILILWAITLALLITGLIFLFSNFEDNQLFTRIALSLAAMMSIISLAFSIYAMIQNKEFSKDKGKEKQNLKFKLKTINDQNKTLYEEIVNLAKTNNIEMLDLEYTEYNSLELANHFNEELTMENARIRSEIEAKKLI